MTNPHFDEIGYWSEIKLDIVREYASAYSKNLAAQTRPSLYHAYIDAFAGAGIHISRASGGFIPGSPLNALNVSPPFKEYHFIDLDNSRIQSLANLSAKRIDVKLYHGDCNKILLESVFPKVRYDDYRRALCLLDPYGLHLNWEVVRHAGSMKSVEIFLNFPTMDMNRNILWSNPKTVSVEQIERMNSFWGDDSWRKAVYDTQNNLFQMEMKSRNANETVVMAYVERLKKIAGFENVLQPMPMRNSTGATIYYLIFASQKPVAAKIVTAIFKKYKSRGVLDGS